RAPHPPQRQSAVSAPAQAGQASSARNASTASEDCVDERRKRLDGGGQNQHQAEDAEKPRERDEPALARLAAPQPAREIRDRSAGARGGDQPPPARAALSVP